MKLPKNLKKWYENLSPLAQQQLWESVSNSPKAKRFLEFLQQAPNTIELKKLIAYIYPEELVSTDYKTLENRFFKLRKKIFEAVSEPTQSSVGFSVSMAQEEQVWLDLRRKVQLNQFTEAFDELEKLYQIVVERNIFELWVPIIEAIVSCYQTFREKNLEVWLQRWEMANEVVQAWNQHKLDVREIYQIVLNEGYLASKDKLTLMQQRASKYDVYPRFMLVYHYTVINSSVTYNKNILHITQRHFNQIFKIRKTSPIMPLIIFRENYAIEADLFIKFQWSLFLCSKNKFDVAVQVSDELWEAVKSQKLPSSESFFGNRIYIQVAAKRNHEAVETAKEYILFLRNNHKLDRIPFAYTQLVAICVSCFPDVPMNNMAFFQQQFKLLVKDIEKNPEKLEAYHKLADLYALKLMLACVTLDLKSAYLEYPKAASYFEEQGLGILKEFFYLLYQWDNLEKETRNAQCSTILEEIRAIIKTKSVVSNPLSLPHWVEKILCWYINEK